MLPWQQRRCCAQTEASQHTTGSDAAAPRARSTELFSYEDCIFYTVVTAVATLPRTELKARVVDAPEILTVIDAIPHLAPFLAALYACDYKTLFRARGPGPARRLCSPPVLCEGSCGAMGCRAPQHHRGAGAQAFADLMDRLRADRLLAPHFRYYVREVRAVAYTQARAPPSRRVRVRRAAPGSALCLFTRLLSRARLTACTQARAAHTHKSKREL